MPMNNLTMVRQYKIKKVDTAFRILFHEPTIKKIEKITQKRYNNNGERLINEILDKIGNKKK